MTTQLRIIFCLLCGLCISNACGEHVSDGNSIHWNAGRGYRPFATASSSGLLLDNITDKPLTDGYRLAASASDFSLRFMASNRHNNPSKSYPYFTTDGIRKKVSDPAWGFYFIGVKGDSLTLTVKTMEQPDAISSRSVMEVSAVCSSQKTDSKTVVLSEGIDVHEGPNIWNLSVKNGIVTLSCGNHGLKEALSLPNGMGDLAVFGFMAMPGACLKVSDITFTNEDTMRHVMQTAWSNPDHLQNYLKASKDNLEGYWIVFDRNLEESYLQLGGDYRFAMVKAGSDYQLIYLDGARVNGAEWRPGMVKARFTPDSFPGIYSVEWFDSQGQPLSYSIKAQEEDGNVLSIQFPYNSSSMRLRRLP